MRIKRLSRRKRPVWKKLHIDGARVAGDLTLEVVNPATVEVLALCPHASEAQLNRAVAAARAAWHRRAITERGQIILVWADRLEQDAESPARLLTQEKGKPLTESTA